MKKVTNNISILFALFLIILSNSIESKPLDEIFSIAIEAASNEPFVVSSRVSIEAAEAELSASKRARLPVFNASIVNALTIDRKIDDRNSLRKIEDEGLDFRLQMIQPVFTGFTIQSEINKNKARVSSYAIEANKNFSKTIIESVIAYVLYNSSLYQKKELQKALLRAKEILELEKKRYNAGLTNLSIFSQVRVKYSEIQLLYNQAEQNLLYHEANYIRLFPFEEKPDGSNVSYSDYEFLSFVNNKDSYDMESLKYDLAAAEADLLKSRGARLPSVALQITGTYYDVDGSDQEVDEYDIKGGLQASWQILDFGANRKRVSAKRSVVSATKYKIDYQRRVDEVTNLSLLANIASTQQQINEQYVVLNDLINQSLLMESQLTASEFIGLSLIDVLFQKNQIQMTINQLESYNIQYNLELKMLSQSMLDFVVSRSLNVEN